ncbi:nuclear transport factor 2 family protein [Hymenobacter sp. RP-2-7]|uniref:Nuclear transport factor 2 family protein n=1 Tax=Hymenobacter polaris TaxID=2682546 RepID=A0A7Y0AFK3_9BACT|nr:nuclear transport factor 2 family protein [Hymenobacter polaris]NML66454.1 nuclear transport factor 2 family protein [Hymenobacter polaris]
MKAYLPIVCVAALLASCSGKNNEAATTAPATGTTAPAGTTADVASLDQQFISAWNSKDAAKVASMLGDDVQFLQGETHFSGKGDVTNKWVTPTINTISNLKTNTVSSSNSDALAYEAGTFSVDVLPSGTERTTGEGQGNYVFIWKKASDGTWKLSLAQLEDLPVQTK